MDSSEEYRAKALEILVQADGVRDHETRTQLLNIARLADKAEREGRHYSRDEGPRP